MKTETIKHYIIKKVGVNAWKELKKQYDLMETEEVGWRWNQKSVDKMVKDSERAK